MKRLCRSTLLAFAIVLTACGGPSTSQATSPTAAPTQPISADPTASGSVTASAVAAPARVSQMGFIISAPVKEVAVKEGQVVQAGQTLMVLDTPELEYSMAAAEAAVSSAQAEAEIQSFRRKTFNQAGKVVYLSGPPELREKAEARLQQAQAALEVAQATLAQGTLVAPYPGTVVSLNVSAGELVQPGQVVVVIGDLDHLQIDTTDLSERQIAKVKIGQTALVHVEALGQDFNGKVVAIAPMASKYNEDWVYKVTIELDQQPPKLMWGMSADVEIQTTR